MGTIMRDRIGSIFWLVVGVCAAVYACRLGLGRLRHPGPGFIFFICSVVLVILGSVNLARTFIRKPSPGVFPGAEPMWKGLRWQRVLAVLIGLSAYAYFMNSLGFLLSNFLLMVFLYKGVEPTKWRTAIVASLATVLFAYLVFQVLLEVQFPRGILGF